MKLNLRNSLALLAVSSISAFGQTETDLADTSSAFQFTDQCVSMTITPALRDLAYVPAYAGEEKEHEVKNNLRRQKYTNADAYPHGPDPIWQGKKGELHGREPIQNWEGNDNGAYPPDPSGAAGPNHYIQMINSEYIIYDKEGTILLGPNSLSSIIGSDAGDPIVMYDRFAERWLLSGFGVGNQLAVAISTTSDPLGTYYLYTFNLGSFPDYPKYGLWHDGYYVTSNTGGADCYIFERDKMLAGDLTASMIAMTIPSLGTGAGTETGGFRSVLPAHADFDLPPADKKLNLFYFQDDAWTGIPDDAIKIWEVTVDWDSPDDSDIDLVQTLLTTPFDSQFNASWNDIEQPGTGSKLDGVPGALMYRAQYTEWDGHNTVMLNHTVDVDETNHAGVRWYELRETSGTWGIHQESTYAPDDQSRWMGSISMDYQGNIGLAFAISGSSVYPSLRYTGRYAGDPLGEMTIDEITAVDGTSVQTGINRFGDYAHMSVDPTDDATFWYTGEYLDGGRKTRVFSFKLASDFSDDIGVTALNSPTDGELTGAETIDITITNFGENPQDDFPVSYQINDGAIITETYSAGPIASGETDTYSFTATADMSGEGAYNLKLWTALDVDEYLDNDTLNTIVNHYFGDDIGVIAINSPVSGTGLADENIEVVIENFGTAAQTDFPVTFQVNVETPVTETVAGPLNAGETMTYTFTASADFSALGTYDILAYTELVGDGDLFNDTTHVEIEHFTCAPESTCSFGDGFVEFELGTIDNPSGCSDDGYADYTGLMTDLARDASHDLTIASDWDPQYCSVWIDYNDNNFFEEDEKVVSAFAFDLGATTTIDIPADAPLGEHLLRAKASDNESNVSDPCSDMTYGETEDYMVNIIAGETGEGPEVDFTADIVLAPPTTTISFTDLSTEDPDAWTWSISPGSGWIYAGGTSSTSQNPEVTFNDLGEYTIQLTASNDFGSGTETKTDYIEITNFDGIVENFPFGFELISREENIYNYNLLGSSEPFNIEVHDAMGKLVYQQSVSPTSSQTQFIIDLSGNATGYYLLHVSDSKNSKVQKLLAQ